MELFQPILDTIQTGLPKILIISKIRDPLVLSSLSNVATTSPRLLRSVSDFGPATHKIGIVIIPRPLRFSGGLAADRTTDRATDRMSERTIATAVGHSDSPTMAFLLACPAASSVSVPRSARFSSISVISMSAVSARFLCIFHVILCPLFRAVGGGGVFVGRILD